MSDLLQASRDLPWSSLILLALGVLVGLLLWAAGRRVLRAAFGALGLVVGAVAGWLAGNAVNLAVPPWAVAIAGGILLLAIGLLAYRFAVAGGLAIIVALAAALAAWSVIDPGRSADGGAAADHRQSSTPDDDAPAAEADPDDPARGLSGDMADFVRDLDESEAGSFADEVGRQARDLTDRIEIDEQTRQQIDRVRGLGGELVEAARQAWAGATPGQQTMLGASAVAGFLLGLLLGTLWPGFGASVVTAFGGSLIWLASAWVLAARLGAPEGPWLPATAPRWLMWWLITSLLGIAIQWMLRPRPADKPA